MNSNWLKQRVGDLQDEGFLRVEDGNHGEYRPRPSEFSSDGTAFIRASNVVNGIVDFEAADRITTTALARIRKGIGAPGDILLTHKGTVGRVALVPHDAPPFVCSPQTTYWRVLDERQIDREYLFAYLRSPAFAQQLYARMHGSDMAPYVSLTEQKALSLDLPPLNEQRAIGRVLHSLDHKIENSRRLARTLEEIAAVLFKARFIEFLGCNNFVVSAIGPIPQGWSVTPVGDLARYVNGKAFTKFGNGRGRMVIRIAELRSGPGASTVYSDYETTPDFLAAPGDILFAWSGSLDVYRWQRPEALINQHIFKVIPQDYPDWFVFFSLKLIMPHFQAIAADKATTMGHIKRADLHAFSIAAPPASALREHDAVFVPLFERAFAASREAETLAQVRDQLLPRLVSGQIRLPPEQLAPETV